MKNYTVKIDIEKFRRQQKHEKLPSKNWFWKKSDNNKSMKNYPACKELRGV